ncbi:MAG: 5-bromo-4-chloroindolyl phosphate hydrolysis family protein [Clostridiales bacterium]|nr:5-bromo-4-chloroindolyl phosphate hydrolysis family protein [Clostridiales bacterium]
MQNNKTGCSVGLLIVVAAVIVLLFAFKNLFWWLIGIITFIIIMGAAFLLIYNSKEKKKKEQVVTDGITVGDISAYILKSESKLQSIRRNYYKLKDDDMRKELDLISDRFKKITKIVKDDPTDFKVARRYLNAMLTSLETIVSQSVKLFESPELSEEGKASLKNAKEGMQLLRESANNQINKLYENNILELDVEIEVLKKSLAARGLTEGISENIDSIKEKGENNE